MSSTYNEADSDLTLGQLLTRSLASANIVLNADSPNELAMQNRIHSTLSDLKLCSSLISHLSILSPNETLEEVQTRDLRCLLVDALSAQLQVLVKTKGAVERMQWLQQAKTLFASYVALIDRYQVVAENQRSTFAGPQHATQDPTRRRESKIAQYKMEKEIKNKLDVSWELRKRRNEQRTKARGTRISPTSSSMTATTSSSTAPTTIEPDPIDDDSYDSDDDETEVARPLYIQLLLQHYVRAHAELASIEQELELLSHGMKMSDLPSGPSGSGSNGNGAQGKSREGEDDTSWRLDKVDRGAQGPLLDKEGKVLRPFTILPSSKSSTGGLLSTRLRLQSEVFRSGHRLPTMSIDEFLDQEQERGNILQGGGPSSSDAVDQARRDEQAEKEDDTQAGYDREEKELWKAREWDDYRDAHRKGEGNMHNRG
ncbi:BQ5605_C005g03280 [Microbotryum silenes-dioicae]|uniref:BQ5605_C005g03280 protein n=1 Tax=Microbotryum silenes-dioicae TaxID=796604 RepID=A0A2X0MEV5_9BASI|nr:BQ5605_C005g03280 [Microbotryum silenes-dioicae]